MRFRLATSLILLVLLGAEPAFPALPCYEALVRNSKRSSRLVLKRIESRLFPKAVEELGELVAMRSVSSPRERNDAALVATAQRVAGLCKNTGLENVVVEPNKDGAPLVTANWLHAKGKPTVLLYAHYDVFSPGNLEGWASDPFKMVLRGERLYGRGVADDKGGLIALLTALKGFNEERGKFPVNVKIIVEGGEEIGADLTSFIVAHREKFAADVVLICDGENHDTNVPSLTASLRGRIFFDVKLSSTTSPQHSGLYGNLLPNPANELALALATLSDPEYQLTLDELFPHIKMPTGDTVADHPIEFYLQNAGALPGVVSVAPGDYTRRVTRMPSLNWVKLESDAEHPGAIPSKAWTTFSVRTVPNMTLDATEAILRKYFAQKVRYGLHVELNAQRSNAVDWWVGDPTLPALSIAQQALTSVYGTRTVVTGMGGFLPLVRTLETNLGIKSTIFYAVADPASAFHGYNESVHPRVLLNAMKGTALILESLGKPSALTPR